MLAISVWQVCYILLSIKIRQYYLPSVTVRMYLLSCYCIILYTKFHVAIYFFEISLMQYYGLFRFQLPIQSLARRPEKGPVQCHAGSCLELAAVSSHWCWCLDKISITSMDIITKPSRFVGRLVACANQLKCRVLSGVDFVWITFNILYWRLRIPLFLWVLSVSTKWGNSLSCGFFILGWDEIRVFLVVGEFSFEFSIMNGGHMVNLMKLQTNVKYLSRRYN
jgi:hypothetical protein